MGRHAHPADRHRRCGRVPGLGARFTGEPRQSFRDRRTGGRLLWRHHAGVRTSSRIAPSAVASACADSAFVGSLARARHAGAGPGRTRARRRIEERDGRTVAGRSGNVHDRTDATAHRVPEGYRRWWCDVEGGLARSRRRCAGLAGVRTGAAHRRREWLVLRQPLVEDSWLAGSMVRRSQHESRTARPGLLHCRRRHRRLDRRRLRARSADATRR